MASSPHLPSAWQSWPGCRATTKPAGAGAVWGANDMLIYALSPDPRLFQLCKDSRALVADEKLGGKKQSEDLKTQLFPMGEHKVLLWGEAALQKQLRCTLNEFKSSRRLMPNIYPLVHLVQLNNFIRSTACNQSAFPL